MTTYYADTSALVKRYVNEPGSPWLRAQFDPATAPLIMISHLTLAEISSAFNRRVREGALTPDEQARLRLAFRADCLTDYQLLPISQAIIDLSSDLLDRHPLRTLDAIQLATGLTAQRLLMARNLAAPIFVSADDRLLSVAAAVGLLTDNPLRHP